MNTLIMLVISTGIVYVVGGFIYAGRNAMIDLNWVVKLYKSIIP